MTSWAFVYSAAVILEEGETSGVRIEWNPLKAAANLRKHDVSFEEASSVFFDPLSAT